MSDYAPELSGLRQELETITGDEPMLSGVNLKRMGKMQIAFMAWLKDQLAEMEEITLLAAWCWVDEYTGNAERVSRIRRSRARKREMYRQFTSARLGQLLHSFHRRGLILVIKHDDGFSFIKARTGLRTEQ